VQFRSSLLTTVTIDSFTLFGRLSGKITGGANVVILNRVSFGCVCPKATSHEQNTAQMSTALTTMRFTAGEAKGSAIANPP
jgi:hypothetical protein